MCVGGVERVVFGAHDPKAGSCGSVINLFDLPYNHKPDITSGILAEECSSILSRFFLTLRERNKQRKKAKKEEV